MWVVMEQPKSFSPELNIKQSREVIKLFFILNSTEHEISTAHKNLNAKNERLFLISNSQVLHLSC